MSIEGMRVAWQGLAFALDGFYERAEEPLLKRQRLGEDSFAVLAEFVGPMVDASATIRTEAEEELAHTADEDRERVSVLLLAGATLDLVLASDLAALEPIAVESTAVRSLIGTFDKGVIESEARLAEIPSPREIFAEGQETIGQVAALFTAIPAVGGGEHRPRSRPALIGDVRDAVVNLVDLAESPGSELVKGFTSSVGAGISQVFRAAAHGEGVKALQEHVGGIVGHSPKFLHEHIAKIVSLCPEAWIVDEATSALSEKLNARIVLVRISASDEASERSRDWIEHTPQAERLCARHRLPRLQPHGPAGREDSWRRGPSQRCRPACRGTRGWAARGQILPTRYLPSRALLRRRPLRRRARSLTSNSASARWRRAAK